MDKEDPLRAMQHPLIRERIMKTSIIAAAVLVYAVLTTAWICYTELTLP
ncbi:hypothetical protein ACFDR9_000941 [Janthinobacterium sp. CG_23.3]|nr:hypothetical protein [Janthinobacterium sp. CG3]MEC5161637.1 hypothetical protein [Janthinobacterium sp. CG_S6]